MPNTPSVNFNFVNNNAQATTPQLGISHVVARTTKGPFNRPDEVLSTYSQFKAIYGEEIVPDGTISNIKKAFEMGSKLRVSRVAGGTNPSYGYAGAYSSGAAESATVNMTFTLKNPNNAEETIIAKLAFRTKEQGSAIVDPSAYGLNKDFYLRLSMAKAAKTYITLTQAKAMTDKGEIKNDQVMDTRTVISYSTDFIDVATFRDFINNVPNLEVEVTDIVFAPVSPELANRYKANGAQGIITLLQDYDSWTLTVSGASSALTVEAPGLFVINEGSNGGDSTKQTWEDAYEAIASYDDAYALILSHVHQHVTDSYTEIYKAVADKVKPTWDLQLYVEVPKNNTDGSARTDKEVQSALETMVNTIGQDKSICYFGGGIKYYDESGVVRNCDVLGTVLGLGDTTASQYGPWYSFAGMNRGIVSTSLGPVMPNLGASSKKPVLQNFAEWYMNLFLIKDTRFYGKRTMLWHSFTSHPKSDSYKFLSVARLNLYIKKQLKPILESYIEEPNIWNTWKNIYFEVKDIFTDLVDRRGISEWTWIGDQDAQSYADLTLNTEADVRAGKYHAQVKFKDIVTMQEITMDIVTDASTGSIEINM